MVSILIIAYILDANYTIKIAKVLLISMSRFWASYTPYLTLYNRYSFILNGLENANHILDERAFNIDDWRVIGEYVYDVEGGRHQAFYSPKKDVKCLDVCIKEGERVQVEQSLKYSDEESQILWERAGLKEIGRWSASKEAYSKSSIISKSEGLKIPSLLKVSQIAEFLSEINEILPQFSLISLLANINSYLNCYASLTTRRLQMIIFLPYEHALYYAQSSSKFCYTFLLKFLVKFQGYARRLQKARGINRDVIRSA